MEALQEESLRDCSPPQHEARTSLVELKNGKLVFSQKPISLASSSETIQEMALFSKMLTDRIQSQDSPLESIPVEHIPLIAKLVHESDSNLKSLANQLLQLLSPVQLDPVQESAKKMLSVPVLEAAIKSVATRTNYGLDSNPSGGKAPTQLCIWRWEVSEEHHDWLPHSIIEGLEARLRERCKAKEDIAILMESLSVEERTALMGRKTSKRSFKSSKANEDDEPVASGSGVNDKLSPSTTQKSIGRPKKVVDPEKAAKEKEKQALKAAKFEKEKKEEEAKNKSASLMANFFGKPKPIKASAALNRPSNEPSACQSDFQKTFKPFALKKGAERAPINWFHNPLTQRKRSRAKRQTYHIVDDSEVIIIDDEPSVADVEMRDVCALDVGAMSDKDRLTQIISSLQQISSFPARKHLRKGSDIKSSSRHTVRSILNEISEAEISGDALAVRSLVGVLRNRSLIPAKVLIFSEDSRPGYYGSWTRSSTVVGPRNPFARDTVTLDYSYDSGEEWEEEDPDEADDVVEDSEDEGQDEEKDSDVDSWLVDDDEVEGEPVRNDRELLAPIGDELSPSSVPKRKVQAGETNLHKKRKVIPLVPLIKGPVWETSISKSVDIFKPYRIRLFNDASCPIDPFIHVSTVHEEKRLVTSDPRFVVPAIPEHVLSTSNSNGTALADSTAQPMMKKSITTPKQPFPDTHLPTLLATIDSLATGSLVLIVETVYQQLKDQKVKKNSVEAKVKEVAAKENKIWIVKADIRRPDAVS